MNPEHHYDHLLVEPIQQRLNEIALQQRANSYPMGGFWLLLGILLGCALCLVGPAIRRRRGQRRMTELLAPDRPGPTPSCPACGCRWPGPNVNKCEICDYGEP